MLKFSSTLESDFNQISIMMCDRQVDCCNLFVNTYALQRQLDSDFLKNYVMELIVAIYRATTLFVEI